MTSKRCIYVGPGTTEQRSNNGERRLELVHGHRRLSLEMETSRSVTWWWNRKNVENAMENNSAEIISLIIITIRVSTHLMQDLSCCEPVTSVSLSVQYYIE